MRFSEIFNFLETIHLQIMIAHGTKNLLIVLSLSIERQGGWKYICTEEDDEGEPLQYLVYNICVL